MFNFTGAARQAEIAAGWTADTIRPAHSPSVGVEHVSRRCVAPTRNRGSIDRVEIVGPLAVAAARGRASRHDCVARIGRSVRCGLPVRLGSDDAHRGVVERRGGGVDSVSGLGCRAAVSTHRLDGSRCDGGQGEPALGGSAHVGGGIVRSDSAGWIQRFAGDARDVAQANSATS